jgi:hypothetical protein
MELIKAELNLPVVVLTLVIAIALVAFLIYRNLKDKRELEEEMDTPLPPREHHPDLDEDAHT